ncbi:MAG TPA: SDR family NAD(P)-dependent oxidoreductase, partial [Acidimicrobiales bacterium]|nr:SDR family NAD(P)-dependent oxidoreductase [Acidimicrobiales bacterium]
MEFAGRVAVVTGGGTGMGRELVRQLAAAGCHVAACDVSDAELAETARLARAEATGGAKVATGHADVADLAAVERFRDAAIAELGATCVHLVFNNAGIAGGGSFVRDD